LWIPAQFVPDILYIQAGAGGVGPTTSAALGVAGQPTYVAIEPSTTLNPNATLLYALGGTVTATAATITVGGGVGTAPVAATIANMPLAGRGMWTALAGQNGTAGGSGSGTTVLTAGGDRTLPTTGLMVTGGTGGGAANKNNNSPPGNPNTSSGGGAISGINDGSIFFTNGTPGANAFLASGLTGEGDGVDCGHILKNSLMHYGGIGGRGADGIFFFEPTTAFAGGNGAPGCGGGGSGSTPSGNNILLKAGDGGPGFVYIISW
jgi:hypothetical protein